MPRWTGHPTCQPVHSSGNEARRERNFEAPLTSRSRRRDEVRGLSFIVSYLCELPRLVEGRDALVRPKRAHETAGAVSMALRTYVSPQRSKKLGKQESPACRELHDQNRKAIPADGCAVCVQLSVLSALTPKSASL